MINDTEFTCKQVLFADILGTSKLIMEQEAEAKRKLTIFRDICNELIADIETEKRYFFKFSDSIVVGFKEIKDAISFSKKLFRKTFDEKIHLRGTIGIGEFKTGLIETGQGLVLASFAEKFNVNGHTLLMVCKLNENINCYDSIIFKEIPGLSKEFKVCIVPWWEKFDSNSLKSEIDMRLHGLTVKDVEYLEKTKENMKYFDRRDHQGDVNLW